MSSWYALDERVEEAALAREERDLDRPLAARHAPPRGEAEARRLLVLVACPHRKRRLFAMRRFDPQRALARRQEAAARVETEEGRGIRRPPVARLDRPEVEAFRVEGILAGGTLGPREDRAEGAE